MEKEIYKIINKEKLNIVSESIENYHTKQDEFSSIPEHLTKFEALCRSTIPRLLVKESRDIESFIVHSNWTISEISAGSASYNALDNVYSTFLRENFSPTMDSRLSSFPSSIWPNNSKELLGDCSRINLKKTSIIVRLRKIIQDMEFYESYQNIKKRMNQLKRAFGDNKKKQEDVDADIRRLDYVSNTSNPEIKSGSLSALIDCLRFSPDYFNDRIGSFIDSINVTQDDADLTINMDATFN